MRLRIWLTAAMVLIVAGLLAWQLLAPDDRSRDGSAPDAGLSQPVEKKNIPMH